MTSLILHPTAAHRSHPNRAATLRSAVLAIAWLTFAAAAPLGAVFFAAASQGDAGVSAPHVAPYIEAKVGRP